MRRSIVFLLAALAPSSAALPDLCTFAGFKFHVFHGHGSFALAPPSAASPCAVLTMNSTDASAGAAASFDSPPFPVRALGAEHPTTLVGRSVEAVLARDALGVATVAAEV